jgi:cell division protein FtsB
MGRSRADQERRTARRRTFAVVVSLLVVAATLLAVPAQSYLDQRDQLAQREAELAERTEANDALSARLQRLSEDDEITRLARRDLGLVLPGEESYAVLPPPTAGLVLPRGWPFDRLAGPIERAATGGS